jgi:hypothetical protein
MSEHLKLLEYPHKTVIGNGCGCVECEHVFIHNESLEKCKNSACDHYTLKGNFGYCRTCTKQALDSAFTELQVKLGITP